MKKIRDLKFALRSGLLKSHNEHDDLKEWGGFSIQWASKKELGSSGP